MSSSGSQGPESWIASFCQLLGHEYFAEVSEDFIEDDFNLTGLQSQVPMYKEALEMILDVEPDDEDEEDEDEDEDEEMDELGIREPTADPFYRRPRHTRVSSDLSVIESSAELLYGLIHQRYITSRAGIQQMAEKYEHAHFGKCPRVFCNHAKVLPVGCHDTPGIDTVKLFCPACLDVYTPPNSRFQSVDGAFFGTTFGSLFFMTFPEYDINTKGDPGNLASTNPIFAPLGGNNLLPPNASSNVPRTQSRSSSLTSNNNALVVATSSGAASTIPAEWIPPPGQPIDLNGMKTHNVAPGLGPGKIHEPKIYGFRVSELAKTGPRMRWLRNRPVDMNELDEATLFHKQQERLLNGASSEEDRIAQEEEEEEEKSVGLRGGQLDGASGANGSARGSGPGIVAGQRKKAAIRRRRGGGAGEMDGVEELSRL